MTEIGEIAAQVNRAEMREEERIKRCHIPTSE
jgi:hypothetical protein